MAAEDSSIGPLVVDISMVLPGGFRETDRMFVSSHDGTCSRCGNLIPSDHVPLLIWPEDGDDDWLYAYCEWCTGALEAPANEP